MKSKQKFLFFNFLIDRGVILMKHRIIALLVLSMIQISGFVMAQEAIKPLEQADPSIFGYEIEKLLNLGSGLLALGLFLTTLTAYRRNQNKRLLYVSMAFLMFSIKGFLTSLELISLDLAWVDPIASMLNFAIILSFFFGVLKK